MERLPTLHKTVPAIELPSHISSIPGNYAYLGVQQSDYIDLFSSDSVSLDKDKYISEIKKDMNELGYDTENLSFQAIPLSVDAMKKLRDQELNNGLLEKAPVYNFINDRLVDESAVLRPLS